MRQDVKNTGSVVALGVTMKKAKLLEFDVVLPQLPRTNRRGQPLGKVTLMLPDESRTSRLIMVPVPADGHMHLPVNTEGPFRVLCANAHCGPSSRMTFAPQPNELHVDRPNDPVVITTRKGFAASMTGGR